MRLVTLASSVIAVTFVLVMSGLAPGILAQQPAADAVRAAKRVADGQAIFRFDTFGDEQFWTDVLRMHEVVPSVTPATALAVGLKVDADALPRR